LNIKLFSQDEN